MQHLLSLDAIQTLVVVPGLPFCGDVGQQVLDGDFVEGAHLLRADCVAMGQHRDKTNLLMTALAY
jgi:hypothetical protein